MFQILMLDKKVQPNHAGKINNLNPRVDGNRAMYKTIIQIFNVDVITASLV
jgi:hypothetical protein